MKSNFWPAAPRDLRFVGNEVHVWASSLRASPEVLSSFTVLLSRLEIERARRFKFDLHRNRFIVGRGLLRTILARYLRISPAKLEFVYSPQGKPALDLKGGSASLHFNLAHSEDLMLLAVTRIGPVGVDIEAIRPVQEMNDLAASFFSKRENELFQQLPSNAKPAAFFNLWARKEAWLKATGDGITESLNHVEVSFMPDEPAHIMAISGDAEKAASWSLHALSAPLGFVGAMAIQDRSVSLRCWSKGEEEP